MRSNGLLTSLTGALLLTGAPASAATLAEYNFNGGSSAVTPSASPLAVTPVSIGEWTDGKDGNGTPVFDSGGESFAAFATDTRTLLGNANLLSNAIDAGDYISLTLNWDSAQTISISKISFKHKVENGGPFMSAHLLTDETGLTASDSLFSTTRTTNGTTDASVTLDSNADLQNVSGPLVIYIYLSDSYSGSTDAALHRIDDILIEGTIVPEPGSLALLGLGGAFLLWHRRRV